MAEFAVDGPPSRDEVTVENKNNTGTPMRTTNPFAVDERDVKDALNFNPFGDAENADDESEEALSRQRAVTESLAPFTLASMLTLKTSSSESTPSRLDMPGKRYAPEIRALEQLGFDRVCSTAALVKTSGCMDNARAYLFSRLLDDNILVSNRELYMWRSPVVVRIGSWLPNVKDRDGMVHTAFFITVTMSLGNETWRVVRRYSEFYTFYCALYNRLRKVFPRGTVAAFPSDRISNWLGVDAEVLNDKRQKALDAWMREICNAPEVMLDDKQRKNIFSFLEVDDNLAKIARARGEKSQKEGGGDGGKASRAFRSRSLIAAAAPPRTTPTTSAWRAPSCCEVPVIKITHARETVSIDEIMREYSATGGGGERGGIGLRLPPPADGLFENPEAALAMQKKAARTISNHDDESHRGHVPGMPGSDSRQQTPPHGSPARAGGQVV